MLPIDRDSPAFGQWDLMHMLRRLLPLTVSIVIAAGQPAAAGTFEVKGVDVDKGVTEVGVNSAFFRGFPVNAETVRSSIEIGASYGFSDWWKLGAKVNLNQPVGGDLVASTAGIEGQVVLRKFDKGFGMGWYTGADFALRDDETNTLTFGPIVQFGTEKTSLTVNPLFARTFGQNRSPGVDFTYAWGVKHELREGFAVGIEGYGVIPNIGHSPGIDFQEHRIGPMIYLQRELGGRGGTAVPAKGLSIKDMTAPMTGGDAGKDAGGPKLNIEAGVLFGLTDGTQDIAFKLKGSITF